MSELRKDPIVGRWVIIATGRAQRPSDFATPPEESWTTFCPFCEGNEDRTPKEILAYRPETTPANSPGWSVRVVPNRFPALQVEGDLDARGVGMYDMMNGVGAHEVFIECPQHVLSPTEYSAEHFSEVIRSYKERMLDLRRDKRLLFGMLFKNVGKLAGASLEHSHSQLIALPVVPKRIREEETGAYRFFDYRGRCVYCDMIRQEIGSGERVVTHMDAFIAFVPYASRFPFEVWVLPKEHQSHFEFISDDERKELAHCLRSVLLKLERALAKPPYNYIVHTAPFDQPPLRHYHWHIEIIPRLTRTAGFEWGTGFYINPVLPEDAARFLQDIDVSDQE